MGFNVNTHEVSTFLLLMARRYHSPTLSRPLKNPLQNQNPLPVCRTRPRYDLRGQTHLTVARATCFQCSPCPRHLCTIGSVRASTNCSATRPRPASSETWYSWSSTTSLAPSPTRCRYRSSRNCPVGHSQSRPARRRHDPIGMARRRPRQRLVTADCPEMWPAAPLGTRMEFLQALSLSRAGWCRWLGRLPSHRVVRRGTSS